MPGKNTPTVQHSEIQVDDDRFRKDLGDIEGLAKSIAFDGLLQPLVITQSKRLIAGERRYRAFELLLSGKVEGADPKKFNLVPVRYFEDLEPDVQRRLEIEENVRRKSMTWQEIVRGIAEYHRLARRAARQRGEDTWMQSMTAETFNVSQGYVSQVLTLDEELKKDPDGPVSKASSATDGLRILAAKKLDEANKEIFRRAKTKAVDSQSDVLSRLSSLKAPTIEASETDEPGDESEPGDQSQPEEFKPEDFLNLYRIGDALELLANEHCSSIITDPPYAIDMENLAQDEDESRQRLIDKVRDEHDVEQNKKLIEQFLPLAFDAVADDGFLVMWYDLDQHEFIANHAKKVGWQVCRWPFIWCKTTPCANRAASYNMTKTTEVCYFMRKSSKSILRSKLSKNYILAPDTRNKPHPFIKPTEVWLPLFAAVSSTHDRVIDPFAGCGSSLYAGVSLERNMIGFELKESHVATGINYIAQLANAKFEPSPFDFV